MRRCKTVAASMLATLFLSLAAAPALTHAQGVSASARATEDATQIAQDAYLYFYPLVTQDLIRRQASHPAVPAARAGSAANTFAHERNLAEGSSNRDYQPQIDMLTSDAWVDLAAGPVILSAADSQGRDYSLTLRDMWSDVFAVIGKRTTGTARGQYIIVPSGWTGTLPSGMQRLDAPTSHVWINGLIQVDGPADLTAARALQDGLILTPLAQWNQPAQSQQIKADSTLDTRSPVREQVESMPTDAYFTYAAQLLRKNPPHAADQPLLARLRRVGLVPGRQWDFDKLDHATKQGMRRGMRAGRERLQAATAAPARTASGWITTEPASGAYGTDYLRRARATQNEPATRLPEELMRFATASDAQHEPLDASRRYLLRFEPDQAPMAALWSLTLYDAQGHLPLNPLNRHVIGSRQALHYQADGALEILIQSEAPEPAGSAQPVNWLAAAPGTFSLNLRLYTPQPWVVDGNWTPPALHRLDVPVPEATETIPTNGG